MPRFSAMCGMLNLFYTYPLSFCAFRHHVFRLDNAFFQLYELPTMLLPVYSPAAVTYYVHYSMPIVDESAVNQL